MKTIELLQKGLDEHHAGRLDSAAQAYSAALEEEPGNVSALRCLGVLRSQQQDFTAALSLLQAAAHFAPEMPEIYNDLGCVLRQKGAYEESVHAFNQALNLQPAFAVAFFNRGVAFEALGLTDQALESYDLALQADPMRLEARFNRAAIRVRRGEYALAAPDLVEILHHNEGSLDAGLLLGRIYREAGKWNDAEQVYRSVAMKNPANADAFVHLGSCRLVLQRYVQAERSCLQALALNPDHAEAHFKTGVTQIRLLKIKEAIEHLSRACDLRPDNADASLQLAVALQRAGLYGEANAAYQRALALAPGDPDAHWNYADLLLLLGEYRNGWDELEWRWQHDRFLTRKWQFSQPRWNGEAVKGKSILLYPEQGFGDVLQFVRYVPMVAALGARVLLGSPPELARLLAGSPGIQRVFLSPSQVPPFDLQCPLVSLPRLFHTEIETIPNRVPYLQVSPTVGRQWKQYFDGYSDKCKVGLIWSGNPGQEHNQHRACRLEDLSPLLSVEGVQFFSLQKGTPVAQIPESTFGGRLIDLGPRLGDFAETAAVMQNLDLFISTDTGPVHLAGGLARPTWLLISAIPDWRWMVGRDDSPWYPTIRLFRQSTLGNWSDVVFRAVQELESFVAAHRIIKTT
jgi:tetratricopeptide (TPR) repeat protein